MSAQLLIAGGGLGGLAAAAALQRAGCEARLFEHSRVFSEVGAGIQLAPNSTRRLRAWGLEEALREVAVFPQALRVRDTGNDRLLGELALGDAIAARYGAPYATVHRADLQALLLAHARREGVRLETGCRVVGVSQEDSGATLRFQGGDTATGDAVVAADGVWSVLRAQLWQDGAAPASGHLAYRATAPVAAVPAPLRAAQVTVWMGPGVHVVAYPVRAGQLLNVVAIVESRRALRERSWDLEGASEDLRAAAGPLSAGLRGLLDAMPSWRVWPVHDRAPLRGPQDLVRGRVALLGDAAHPMRPYLAQGAGMALEDAAALATGLRGIAPAQVAGALQAYAQARWARCARVQATARRNGRVFHAQGLVRWGRDAAMGLLGERLLDQPWLFGG
ncbi:MULTISPECIES: FAD-dependent monooxygenase [Ramlibacter]|uniref:FAD-dependent oxidoreductase n=1 Tax=Ramlibacter aquaticus TaxID=2780094 RepID=A0ABR9S9L3_9BURK|nr:MULTISPECIES: FAD-dependent monooxygenase [Ramlibacter]MBE7939039.1 FAD-dependent oxidoreductase [Ramlibacter aquaticus]